MINRLSIVGAGTMGSGIAQVAAEHGIETVITDIDEKIVKRGMETVIGFLTRKVDKGKLSKDEFEAISRRLKGEPDVATAVSGTDMVIEAAFENLEIKQDIFGRLDSLCPSNVILASNTSTLSISKIASVTKHPERVVGTHFFSPVPVMRLVEVISGDRTRESIVDAAMTFCEQIGKTAISAKDVPGFIVNRFLCLLYNEAANQVHQGLATAKDIDIGLKLGSNHPMGPVEIMDMAGVDVVFNALKAMFEMTGEERYRPSPLFEQMISENRLGRKTGRGFYEYS